MSYEKQASGRSHLFSLDLFNLHSSRWICKEEGSSDGNGLKMEKTLYQEGENGRGRREEKKHFQE